MMERPMFTRFLHVCIVSIALTSLTLVFAFLPTVTTPPNTSSWEQDTSTSAAEDVRITVPSDIMSDDFNTLIDLSSFNFIKNVDSCNDSINLLVAIHSAPNNFEKRLTIRETWGSINNIKVIFMLGFINDSNVQYLINKEYDKFHDIIQGNFLDKYRNITYKHVMAFKWFYYHCNSVQYMLKSDDDVFINMPNLINFLPSLPSSNLIFCDVILKARVKRTWRSKWRVSYQEYPTRYYPDYCAGWAILYTSDVIRTLYIKAQSEPYFWVDDVHLTGVLAKKANIKHISAYKWALQEMDANAIILNNKWPNSSKNILGPYNLPPNKIRSLWKILKSS